MNLVVDFYQSHLSDFYPCLAAQGVSGIARYLTAGGGDPRQLTPLEVAYAHVAGLSVHMVYEMNPTTGAYFTYAQGAEDCRQAVARLDELGAPVPSVVYLAVDTNIDPEITTDYFNGVESMVVPRIVPGVYGFKRMIDHARTNFPNIGKHLWQTYGPDPGATVDLWQHEQVDLCGVAVDLNDCYVEGWKGIDMTDDEFRAAYQRLIAPDLEAEIQARKQEAIDEAVKAVAAKLAQ